MTPRGRSCHSLCICAVNSPVSRDSCLPSAFQTCSIGERSGDLAGHGRTSYPLKTLLGESRNDRVSQEIAPHTVTPCEIAVCRLDNKCRIGPLAGAPPDTCAVVISTETESGFITEDDTSPVCHTPKLPEVGKKSSRHCL
ncbi:hypothetical protein TNCV_4564441 [Trichonephila clavipes]|nr:hypothetical protein TNCV_4564441 [Trichonephila clavipes]